jgi:enterochelin esterase-like enzyme
MGGLVSLNIALRHADIFARVAALSPSCWWAPAELQADLQRYLRSLKNLRLWLDIGGREGEFGRFVPAVARRIRTLLGPDQRTFHFHREPTAGHCEADWGARVHLPLEFLFPYRQRSG